MLTDLLTGSWRDAWSGRRILAAALLFVRGVDRREVFRLVRQYAGASQTQLAITCGMTQGKISEIMRDIQRVIALEVFERIADGLSMPAPARAILGLALRPHQASSAATGRRR